MLGGGEEEEEEEEEQVRVLFSTQISGVFSLFLLKVLLKYGLDKQHVVKANL